MNVRNNLTSYFSMARPRFIQFYFNLSDYVTTAHPVHLSRIKNLTELQKDALCSLIWSYRFVLQNDTFDSIRLRFSDGTCVIRRTRLGSFDYHFDFTFRK